MASQHSENELISELADDLWISICNFLEPFERFILSSSCTAMHGLISMENYPIYSFYKSDINYLTQNIGEWFLTRLESGPLNLDGIPAYALNLHAFDQTDANTLQNIKYFIIFYHRLSTIRINKKIEQFRHLLSLQDKGNRKMLRLDDEPLDTEGKSDDDDDELIAKQMEALQIDLNAEAEFIPSRIIQIYLHEVQNENQSAIHWICDIIKHTHSHCSVFRDTFFDKSNLDNQSVNLLCDALLDRSTPFYALENVYFTGNTQIRDECIERLLGVLYETCPNLIYLSLERTGITDKSCHILLDFYSNFLVMNDDDGMKDLQKKLPKIELIDLSGNKGISVHGVDMLNSIFVRFGEFYVEHKLKDDDAIRLKLDIDVENCNWDVPRFSWSDHILYYD